MVKNKRKPLCCMCSRNLSIGLWYFLLLVFCFSLCALLVAKAVLALVSFHLRTDHIHFLGVCSINVDETFMRFSKASSEGSVFCVLVENVYYYGNEEVTPKPAVFCKLNHV